MRKHIFVRPIRPEKSETDLAVRWFQANAEKNGYDPSILTWPTTNILCAFDNDGPLVFMPVSSPLMMEFVGIRPGAEPEQVAAALAQLLKETVTQGFIQGRGEVYLLASAEETQRFAERHVPLEECPYRVFRLKLSDLEKK